MSRSPLDRADWKENLESLPPVRGDVNFWGMTLTQFLGAFNDNLFKQLVLLLCTDLYLKSTPGAGDRYQALAFAVFTLPFVLFSGFAGFLSDLYEKRFVVILCKVAEIAVMVVGTIAFWMGSVNGLFVVLFFMGAQSAFFGPSKYGILPEAFRSRDLPYVNGVFIMTTFLAIIFGTVLAGLLKDTSGSIPLWVSSLACVVTAVVGTGTSLLVRRTPAANPDMRFQVSNLAIDAQTWRLIRTDRIIFKVLMITSIFWLVSGAIQQAVNGFAKYQLKLNDSQTGLMLSGVAIGIAVGCLLAGKVSKGEINFRVYKVGNAGIVLTLIALGIIGVMGPDLLRRIEGPLKPASAMAGVSDVESAAKETLASEGEPGSGSASTEANAAVGWHVWACGFLLFLTGVSAGLFSVPLQTFLQVRPPDEEKGRVIAAMNLFNWIGILLAAALYFVVSSIIAQAGWPQAVHFLACAGVMALLFLYRIDGKSAPPRPATGVHG